MRVGEPERSGRRDYNDGSAGDAAKYDDARADDDNLGGNDDGDDSLSDFSDNNSDGQYGASDWNTLSSQCRSSLTPYSQHR